jgi:hypothetical protein
MAEAVYILCALTSLVCAAMLIRAYLRAPSRLLLWCALCFVGIALNSILVVLDVMVFPDVDLRVWRQLAASLGLFPLLAALIIDTTRNGHH